ncbi:hypothetical protein C0058_18075 [Pseudomonas sp. NC02]|nr:hypothetical protein C0058_18075 [Pseudomonas sp. NC02]
MGAAVRRFDLLAKAVYQLMHSVADTPPSRASRIVAPPLPHWVLWCFRNQCFQAAGFTRFFGFSPASAASRLSTAHLAIASRVS